MSKAKAASRVAKARVFIPLMKVDEEQRLVYGRATAEELDKADEIMDYATSKPLFEEWSGGIEKATNGLSKGNVRVMHGMVAAGKLTEIDFDDEAQSIEVCAKIVDDQEWEKVVEGVYTGFSVGGSYEKKWDVEIDGKKVKKFTARPAEISIVDNPCVTSATFGLIKADGTEEEVSFQKIDEEFLAKHAPPVETPEEVNQEQQKTVIPDSYIPTNPEVAAKATEIAAEKGGAWGSYIEEARQELIKAHAAKEEAKDGEKEAKGETADKGTEKDSTKADAPKVTPPGVRQVWTASDGETFEKKAEAEAHEALIAKGVIVVGGDEESAADKLRKALKKATDGIEEAETQERVPTVFDDLDRFEKAFCELDQPRDKTGAPVLEKGMYTVSRFADMMSSVAGLVRTIKAEGVLEGDDGEDENVANTLKGSLSDFGSVFLTYAKQQVTELLAGFDEDMSPRCCYDYYYRAVEADPENTLAKDVCDLIKSCEADVEAVKEEMSKAFTSSSSSEDSVPLEKFAKLETEYEDLKKVANEAVEQIGGLVKRVKMLEDKPEPRAPRGVILEKTHDNPLFAEGSSYTDKIGVVENLLKHMTPDELATELIKASQRNPTRMSMVPR